MKYIMFLIILIASIHPINYAKYNWVKKNKLAAVGVVLMLILSVVIPSIYIFG